MNSRFLSLLLLLFLVPTLAFAEAVEIPDGDGGEMALHVHRPPDFDPSQSYSILVSPGNYYWQDRPSQPGWVVVTGDAFFGPGRLARSKVALSWLREQFSPRNGGFHIAGWSANSAGVFEIAMTSPKDFLSVTGIAGMPGPGAEGDLQALEDIRVQFVVGENDGYWRRGSERWHKKMKAQGIHSTLEIIPNGEHVMPEIANEPMFERMNQLVAEIESGD